MTSRAIDLMVALPTLVVAAPLIAGLGLAVRATSPGPAFYVQTRVGRFRRHFRLIKLRSMRHESAGPVVTSAGDERVTAVGAVLRKWKLDELPQIFNVVRGDMSIVGPRPEVPCYTLAYSDEWEIVFTARPGLTDRASIAFRNEERLLANAIDRERAYSTCVLPIKMRLAVQGVRQQSFGEDLRVLLATAGAVLGYRSDEDLAIERRVETEIEKLNERIRAEQ